MANFINWSNLTDGELYDLEKCIKDEKDKRYRQKDLQLQDKSLKVLQMIWPNSLEDSVKTIKCEELTTTRLTIVFTPKIPITGADEPPYCLRLEKSSWKDSYDLHIDLNKHGKLSCSSQLWFNFEANGIGRMGPHTQFKNKQPFPQELLSITFVNDIFCNPKHAFNTYLKALNEV